MKHIRLFCLPLLALLLALAAGCSKIDGTVSANQAPSVSFVNNQQDADEARQTYSIPNYTFIFPDSTTGFAEAVGRQLPYALNAEAKFELIRYQFFFILAIGSIVEVDPITGAQSPVPAANFRLDPDIPRYLWIQHTAGFQWKLGYNYIIDGTFEYRPVYSYAPMVFWKGSDADGFVESFRYLDYAYESEAGLAAVLARVSANDPTLQDSTEDLHWNQTVNTSAVINLTTALGRIQKHVVILQAIDNDGAVSPPALRVFNRSNRAPNTPRMAYYKDGYTRVSQPSEYTRHVIGWEDIETDPTTVSQLRAQVSPYYEIPISSVPLENWRGLRFLVAGNDPDDQALVTIPLQFQFLLNRIPDMLVAEKMAASQVAIDDGISLLTDSTRVALGEDNVLDVDIHKFDEDGFSRHNQIELFNLPTGYYQLAVYSRDDGFELCDKPAWMRFKVQQLNMTKDVLVVDYTPVNSGPGAIGLANDNAYMAYYRSLVEEVMPDVKRYAPAAHEREQNYTVTWHHDIGESANCRYWKMGYDNGDFPLQLPFSIISQYRVVICLDDKWASGAGGGNPNGAWIRNPAKGFWMDYLDMGGALLWSGWSSMVGTFNYDPVANVTTDALALNERGGDFLAQYMGILAAYNDINTTFFNGRIDAMRRGLPEFIGQYPLLPRTELLDSMRIADGAFRNFYTYNAANPYRPVAPDSCLIFIEANAINENLGTIAAFTYDSYTAGLAERDTLEFFRVARQEDLPENFYTVIDGQRPRFDNYSTNPDATGCWLYIPNAARNYWGMQITTAVDCWNVSRPDSMWANPFSVTSGVISGTSRVFIRVNHQRIDNPDNWWVPGQQVNVDAIWRPILTKHRKPLVLYTESVAYQGSFGGLNFNPYFTNFRTAWNNFPLQMMYRGTLPDYQLYDAGDGARGIVGGILFQFYTPKIQDVVD
jgi:hypothetical protein